MFFRFESVNTQRNRDKQRISDLEKSVNEEKQNRQKLELQIKTEKTLTKKLQDDLTKLSSIPPRFVSIDTREDVHYYILVDFRSECTEQCLKRKRDQENESREMRKLLNDKDERVKILDNEIKVSRERSFKEDIRVFFFLLLDSAEISRISSRYRSTLSTFITITRTKCTFTG